jgi:hypothetical protein
VKQVPVEVQRLTEFGGRGPRGQLDGDEACDMYRADAL